MAGFSSTSPIQFAPYVNDSYDPDVYGKIIMSKQQMRDENVQQINSYLSQEAGLDMYREQDKAYLRDKLSQVRSQLNATGGQDFSKQSVAQQALGLASQVGMDKNVQTAVQSTRRVQKSMAEMEKARLEGKSSPSNEWDFNQQVANWSQQEVGVGFGGAYTPYTDVTSEFLKLYKEAHPESKLTQEQIKIGDKGITVLKENAAEGVTPERIANIASTLMTRGDVQRQLSIDGRYTYNGADRNTLLGTLTSDTSSKIEGLKRQLDEIELGGAVSNNGSKVDAATIKDQLKQLNSKLVDDNKKLGGLSDEQLKESLYKSQFVGGLINSFSWSSNKTEIKDDPIYKAQFDMMKWEADQANRQFDNNLRLMDYELKKTKAEQDVKTGGVGEYTQVLPTPESEGMKGEATFNEGVKNTQASWSSLVAEKTNVIAAKTGKLPFKKYNGQYTYNVGGPDGFATKEEAKAAFQKIYTAARSEYNSGNPTPVVTSLFSQGDDLLKNLQAAQLTREKILSSTSPKLDAALTKVGNPSEQVGSVEGKPVTRKDLVDLWLSENAAGGTSNDARVRLESKFGSSARDLSPLAKTNGIYAEGGAGTRIRVADSPTYSAYSSIGKILSADKELPTAFAQREQMFKDAQMGQAPTRTTFDTPDAKTKEYMRGRFSSLLASTTGNTMNTDEMEGVQEWLVGSKGNDPADNTYAYRVDRQSGKAYVNVTRGGETREAEVPLENLRNTIPNVKLNDQFYDKYGSTLSLSQMTKTDVTGTGESSGYPVKAAYDSKYRVRYHLVGDGNGGYEVQLYIRDKSGKLLLDNTTYTPLGAEGMLDQYGVLSAIETLKNDAVVDGLLIVNGKK